MEKIKRYVERFLSNTTQNIRYSVTLEECRDVVNAIRNMDEFDGIFALGEFFSFGYAKGYRAAMAEMKKKGCAA